MGNESLIIKGVGMVSSLGVTALQTLSSMDSGISRKSLMPGLYYTLPEDPRFDESFELIAAPLGFLESRRDDFPEPSRWLSFVGEKAFADLIENSGKNSGMDDDEDQRTGLFVSLPAMLTKETANEKDAFIQHFHNLIEKDIFPVEDYCFEGHTGVFTLMEKARDALYKGEISRAIVGGVQSCLFTDWLKRLDKDYQLKSRRAMDGYIPGEVAAFLWLEKAEKTDKKEIASFTIDAIRLSQNSIKNQAPASALTHVVSGCLSHAATPPVIFGDLNGQSKRMDEWGFTLARMGERLGNPPVLRHPADSLGDMGAASGAVLTIIAIHELQKKYKNHDNALIFTASDHDERAAVLLTRKL